ncbi:MAG: hypothetical protein FWG24_05340 [Eggerthellaceae bacterium]|nr:hypothetical protein [Eggerthellaceae bacterium]MDR2721658.1 hypothetical protein [Coriobacteriaceae bacterium]
MDESSGLAFLGILLFLSGPIFYAIMYNRYRNIRERHYHESETPVQMNNLQVYDKLIHRQTRQSTNRITGANSTRVNGTLNPQRKFFG